MLAIITMNIIIIIECGVCVCVCELRELRVQTRAQTRWENERFNKIN